jgi:hypothetical protein
LFRRPVVSTFVAAAKELPGRDGLMALVDPTVSAKVHERLNLVIDSDRVLRQPAAAAT